MPVQTPNLEARINTLKAVLTTARDRQAVQQALQSANGNWTEALARLKGKVSDATLSKIDLAHALADWTGDDVPVVTALANNPDVTSLRDVALRFNADKLAALVDPTTVPADTPGATPQEKAATVAVTLQHRLFEMEPTAVLQRMVQDAEVPIADTAVRTNIAAFLNNQPTFNIRTTSVYTAFTQPDAFKGIADEHRPAVVEELKTLQRVQAISPVPEAVPVLMSANLTSAFRVAEIPESTFLRAYSAALGEETALQVYTTAINAHIRNEHALMTLRDTLRGSGLAIIDGSEPLDTRMEKMQALADQKGVPLNLDTLFGSLDYCACDDCLSVYSPASYFVDILQYLRNNDLDPKNPNTGKPGITGTPLEKLFRRRPDLGCLELTCENTFTVLPYIDLVNEVMESFVVHLDTYHTDPNVPKQATLEVFNLTDETSSELLAQPEHVNYQAYCILKSAVYPFTLPYHQPIDVIRIWLKYLGTSRYELLDTFRTATETCDTATLTPAQQQELQKLHAVVQDRAVDAEFLGITQEEYIILTREAFWPKRYFDLTLQKDHTDAEYRQQIGVRAVHEYYGYADEADMLSLDEALKIGLTFVKKQFLPRTGVQYTDLVELLKTRFINPAYPQGKALTLMEAIRFSYRFLQTLVDTTSADPKVRFAKLIDFLNTNQPLVPQIEAQLHPDPCHQRTPDDCVSPTDFRDWVYCYFERIGKLIVLESGEGPQLPIEGQLFTTGTTPTLIGTLHKDGTIVDTKGALIGNVTVTGDVVGTDGKPFVDKFEGFVRIEDAAGTHIGYIDANGLHDRHEHRLTWLPERDTCDLDAVRLTHLDGTPVTVDEYDRIQRFIRLWHKLGWTVDETDQALIGLSASPGGSGGGGGTTTGECDYVGFDAFKDDCAPASGGDGGGCPDGNGNGGGNCPDIPPAPQDISPDLLHQLVAVQKLLDLTGLPVEKLLAFWSTIGTAGEQPLYARLFLTHHLLGIDKIFEPDANGNYLAGSAKMSEHLPVVLAALKLKADDLTTIVALRHLPDALTLDTVSALYRHSLLAKLLQVHVVDLPEVIALLGDPFKSAQDTLNLLKDWGHISDAGFTFSQLNYLIRGHDDTRRPVAPAQKTILVLAKTLYDGLNGIDRDHPDVPAGNPDAATADLVRAATGLIYDQTVVEQIVGLLDGTTVYTTNAPANLTITIPAALAGKLAYSTQKDTLPPVAAIQITGILTDGERTLAETLSGQPGWAKAIERAGKQARHFYDDVLYGIFPNADDAIKTLLAGDVNVPSAPQNPAATAANTAPAKRLYFLQAFLPFLRQRLARKLIVDTLSGATGLAGDVTGVLLSDVLTAGLPPQPAIGVLEQIKQQPAGTTGGWKGYLIPAAADAYTFVATSDTQPAPLVIGGNAVPFPHQQDDPSNVWSTDPVKLKAGTLIWLDTGGLATAQLQWKTATSPRAAIPSSALLPDYSTGDAGEALVKLFKAALLANGFTLSADEIGYWQSHAADFDGFDLNAVTLQHWRRLQVYTGLRDALPKRDTTLLELFAWAGKPGDPAQLSARIAAATVWKQADIDGLIAASHFALDDPAAFRNEVHLVKLQTALAVAGKTGATIDRLFAWANPTSKFWVCHGIAEEIRATVRARYDQEDWEKVVQPLNDQLRDDQRHALISYLLVQQDLIDWGVVDADSLFEFFLIDPQMGACMETSRIKQAISTVQLFVQRCLLGMEEQYGVPADALDRDRWEWMQKYRVWEANRKVFLYPENWLRAELRDDKSVFYKQLESDLLQKDINTQNVEDALKAYLFKVDQVANLRVVGLFLEQGTDQNGNQVPLKLHVVSRTRGAPYLFYYRYFDATEKNWYPWEQIQVDIPSYDLDAPDGDQIKLVENGAYVIPVVWNGRLLIFFPQFLKKTASKTSQIGNKKFTDLGNDPVQDHQPVEYWEIKMGWSEYRNGKWTPKQVSAEARYDSVPPMAIHHFRFTPRIMTGSAPAVAIEVFRENAAIGEFQCVGSQLFPADLAGSIALPEETDFHVYETTKTLHSLQAVDNNPRPLINSEPFFTLQPSTVTVHMGGEVNFYHPFAHELVGALAVGGVDALFDYFANKIPDESASVPHKPEAFGGAAQPTVYHELKRAYSLYNWEAAFHAPMQLADRLLTAQQFDAALKMLHYVLNPYAQGTDAKRFWQFPPFKEIDAENVLEQLFLGLQPNQPNTAINEWRDKPFQPHVVARSRPSAYMKWVAMTYIKLWIAYGDYYFRQNTLETIPLAIQCYVIASHVCGPRAQTIPKRGKTVPQTYNSLLDRWDAFGNAMVELELAFPFSNQTPFPIGVSNGVVGLANVFGFATTLYFCIPDNPDLTALRDTIDDRLFKIRHCEDINGVFRQLPLFEPPIDPGLLVQAAAQGLSLSSVLNDLNSPAPNYRFYYLLQKALEMCAELKALGNNFLSVKEKGDAEALAQLRARHESAIQNLVMEVRKQQLDEASKALDALQQSRKGPVYRLQHYLKLIGEDLAKVPDPATDFGELPDQIEQPVDDSGLKLISFEKEEMDKAAEANDKQEDVGRIETLASILHAIPTIGAWATPIGVGANLTIGGSNFGNVTQAVARANQVVVGNRTFSSTNAARKAGFMRQLQDRILQANIAGYEITSIDKQVLTQQIRINIAQQEITNQQKQIDNAQEVEEFLRNKYTSTDLYSWMDSQVRALYYQAYTLAYDLAKKAESLFRFERGLSTSDFIQFGYWDIAHDGLLAGERLHIGLKQLEAAYQEKRGHDFEISKPISLRQLNPAALLQLRETGTCEFAVPEIVFDMDYPGHYMRRIKSVALRIPCVVGAYTSLNCTLRLLEHTFRTSALVKDKNDYPQKTDEDDDRFSTVNVPIASIAVSSLETEAGVFELNFRDDRYLPFEGAGVISKWRIELPAQFRQFDYDTITDVIVHLRYTSLDGGDKLKGPASDAVLAYIKSVENLSRDEGIFAAFDVKNDFASEWYKANQPPAGATERVLTIDKLYEKLPIFTKGRPPAKIQATDIYLFASGSLSASEITATQGGNDIAFTDGPPLGTMKSFVAKDVGSAMDSLKIHIADTKTTIDKMWLLERYVLV